MKIYRAVDAFSQVCSCRGGESSDRTNRGVLGIVLGERQKERWHMNMSEYFDENLINRWKEHAKDVLQTEFVEWVDAADETGLLVLG